MWFSMVLIQTPQVQAEQLCFFFDAFFAGGLFQVDPLGLFIGDFARPIGDFARPGPAPA